MSREAAAAQLPLPTTVSPAKSDRYDTASNEEAAAIGRALLAELRGEELTTTQRALLRRTRSAAPEARVASPVLDRDRTLLCLSRGDNAEIRVRWRRYRGSSPFLDLRRFERGDRGALLPTRQGVTIRAHEVKRLLASLVKLEAFRDAG